MGRKRKNWIPVITEDNQWLADDFLKKIGTIYEEYFHRFRDLLHWPEDIIQEAVLRTYNAILYNGCKSPICVTQDTPEEIRMDIWKNKFFIACRQNSTVGITSDRYMKHRSDNPVTDVIKDKEYISADRKVVNDLYDDYRTMWLISHVCENFDPKTCYCFRVYYLVKGMTYRKLSEMTKMKDAKTRVVEVNRYLRENIEEIQKKIDEAFAKDYPEANDLLP